jgi:ubiquinone/menaquinone biosynthesis C-methylase UbiE
MSESHWTLAEVAEFYDDTSHLSEMINNGYEHLGYWYDDNDDATIEDAAKRLTRKVVDTLGLHPGEHLLDAGCGLGAPANQIATEYSAQVTGITISPIEASKAQARADAMGLSDQVRFEAGDYHALPFPEDHFDAVIAIESLMHSIDLEKALLELRRVLRPGGRIAITEITMVSSIAKISAMLPSRVPMTAQDWVQQLEAAGFVPQEWTECGRRVFGASKRFVDHTEQLRDKLTTAFGQEFFEGVKEAQRETFAPGPEHMSYLILCAAKPTT